MAGWPRFGIRPQPSPVTGVYTKSKKRLDTVPTPSVLLYADNLHTNMGVAIQGIRKSLASTKTDEAFAYAEELHDLAQALLATAEVLKLR